MKSPALNPHFRVAVAPREGVALLSRDGDMILEGAVYERLVPLLDGRRTADAIVDALGGDVHPAEVYYALARLQRAGVLAEAAHLRQLSLRRRTNGMPAEHGPSVALVTVGVDRTAARRALRVAGWRVHSDAALQIVLADDLLNTELG
ncbi:MAG: TOMM precursor leader peptide-binding protein, partial [Gemmatimonadaceae bacterium]